MDYDIRPITDDETQDFRNAIARGFGGDSREEDHDRFYTNLPLGRTVAAFDGGEIVGTLGEFDFQLTVPGGAATCTPSEATPDVRLTAEDLGALYLGGRSAHDLWRAGRIEGARD